MTYRIAGMILNRLRDRLDPWSLFSDSLLDCDLDAYLDRRDTNSSIRQ